MEWIANNWSLLVVIAIVVGYFIVSGKQSVMKWLLYAVSMAEKELGSGTGKLKLVQVYSDFVAQYPVLSKIIPFAVFSLWVDIVLEEMKDILSNNMDIAAYIMLEDKKD